MSLAKKLNLKPGTTLRAVGKPAGVDFDDVKVTTSQANFIEHLGSRETAPLRIG